jgi:hypothetical protein
VILWRIPSLFGLSGFRKSRKPSQVTKDDSDLAGGSQELLTPEHNEFCKLGEKIA